MSRSTCTAFAALTLVALPVAAGDAPRPTEPRATPPASATSAATPSLASELRLLAAARGIVPLPAKPRIRRPLVLLGQALAFDPLLSGT